MLQEVCPFRRRSSGCVKNHIFTEHYRTCSVHHGVVVQRQHWLAQFHFTSAAFEQDSRQLGTRALESSITRRIGRDEDISTIMKILCRTVFNMALPIDVLVNDYEDGMLKLLT